MRLSLLPLPLDLLLNESVIVNLFLHHPFFDPIDFLEQPVLLQHRLLYQLVVLPELLGQLED